MRVNIPKVGAVNFPDNMSTDEVQKHAGRLHRIADISTRTVSVDVTRSLPFAKKAIAKGDNSPALAHFVSGTRKLPDGRDHVDFATGRHTLKSIPPGDGKSLERSEFRKLLEEDLNEATSRSGTKSDWWDIDRPERPGITIPEQPPKTRMAAAMVSALQQRAAERNQ